MGLPELDWRSAEVRDGTLTVNLSGERPKQWQRGFEQTVALLSGGEWERVECGPGAVKVTGVRAGGEDRLRHFLESVVLQANAAHQAAHPEADGIADEAGDGPETQADDPDAELTARFRAFAQ